jgi:hypothetical protein
MAGACGAVKLSPHGQKKEKEKRLEFHNAF